MSFAYECATGFICFVMGYCSAAYGKEIHDFLRGK